jgi:galactose oxidase
VNYGANFDVGTDQASQIDKVSWIRLPSVTHSFDENLRINFLGFQAGTDKVTVTAPASRNECPPGHYMIFLLNAAGAPSVAKIVQIRGGALPSGLMAAAVESEPAPVIEPELVSARETMAKPRAYLKVYEKEAKIQEVAKGTEVVLGITGSCPYGIGSCWAGAYEALGRLDDVAIRSLLPDTSNSTAQVFLKDDGLPPLDKWEKDFPKFVSGTYGLRGVEVTIRGPLHKNGDRLSMASRGARPSVNLKRIKPEEKIQYNHRERQLKPLEPSEANAYDMLVAAVASLAPEQEVTVTGPLKRGDNGYEVHIRTFDI